ncbi:MAG: ABC transporter permease [Nibricoccus sp.]
MPTTLRIALRFLLAKRRAMAMSLTGIALGVGFIILTQAITSGFQEFFIQTILGADGAIRVSDKVQISNVEIEVETGGGKSSGETVKAESNRKYLEGVYEPRIQIEAIQNIPAVRGVSEVVRGNVIVQSATREDSAQVFGIRLDDHLRVSDLGKQIILGSAAEFAEAPSGVMMGKVLAERLKVRLGDSVLIAYAGVSTRYKVVAIYQTGVRDIDKTRIFMHLGEARTLLKRPFGATFLQISLNDPDRAPKLAELISDITDHRAESWKEREQVWLQVFTFFRILAGITVSTIIVVSGLGMFNTLAMIVMEKTKEIAILRSMGFTRRDIAATFMLQGILVLVAGLVLGWGFGAISTWVTEHVPIEVTGIFTTDHVVVSWQVGHYLLAAAMAGVVVAFASWFPARKAARMEPADIIRGASQ